MMLDAPDAALLAQIEAAWAGLTKARDEWYRLAGEQEQEIRQLIKERDEARRWARHFYRQILCQSQSSTDIITGRDFSKTCATCALWQEAMPDSPNWGRCVSFSSAYNPPDGVAELWIPGFMSCPYWVERGHDATSSQESKQQT